MAISLSPELEARIREKIASGAIGSVEAFVERVLRQALGIHPKEADEQKSPEEVDQEVDAFFASLDQNLPKDTPILPDEALSRDAIYEGRG